MIKIMDFKPGHMDFLDTKDMFEAELDTVESICKSQANGNHYVYTIAYGNEVLAIIGGINSWQGFLEVYAVTSKKCPKFAKSFHKSVIALLDSATKELKIHRMQCYVKSDENAANRWIERLGFKKEAVLDSFGSKKENYNLYSRVI